MLTSTHTNKRASTHFKFRDPNDINIRSNRSPLSPARRRPTIENLDEVIRHAEKMKKELEVISKSLTDKRKSTHVKFSGPDDIAHRSAWSTTNQSLKPPSPAERKPTLDNFDEAIHDAGMVVKALGLPPAHEPKKRSQTTPILKVRKHNDKKKKKKHEMNKNDDEQPKSPGSQNKEDRLLSQINRRNRRQTPDEGLRKTRSAFLSDETQNSHSSVFGLAPARRQRTLNEEDLKEAATITAKAVDRTERTRKQRRRKSKSRERSNLGVGNLKW